MKVEFYNTENLISESDVEDIERKIGFLLPVEYKSHLLINNGGKCKPNVFSFIEKEKVSKSSVDWFLAIYDGKYDNLNSYIDIYKNEQKRIPTTFIPIAHDAGGNLICISCSKTDYGYIYFWDHEKEEEDQEKEDFFGNVFFIADSFNNFINGLALE